MKNGPRIAAESFSAKFALTDADEAAGTFKGMASVFGSPIDCYPPSVIEPGAFAKTLADQGDRVKILWQHNMWEPIGRPTSLRETSAGLEIVGRLDPIDLGLRAMTQIKSGTLTDLSIGFDPLKWDMVQDASGTEPIRHIKEVKLWEVSIVTFGAQRAATMAAFALAFRNLPLAENLIFDPAGAYARVKEWARGDQERFHRAFLAGGKDGERFQIADVVDGKLVAVPGAIRAAAEELLGANGFPPRVVEYTKEHLGAYFHKMNEKAPWEKPAPDETLAGKKLSKKSRTFVEGALKAAQDNLDALKALLDHADEGESEEEQPDPATAAAQVGVDAAAPPPAAADEKKEDCSAQTPEATGAQTPEVTAGAAEPEIAQTPEPTPEVTPAEATNTPEPDRLAEVEFQVKEMEMAFAVLNRKGIA